MNTFCKVFSVILTYLLLIHLVEADKQEVSYNILWLVCEDMGPYIPPFGDNSVKTPNLSRLASEGVCYPNLYSTSGVCAPSRFAIATGMYPSGSGANHMRTHSNTEETGLPKYEAVPKPNVKMLSEKLRGAGYYCTNNLKQDYQFKAPVTAWDESGPFAHWRNRKEGQPFFSIFNFITTHESGLFEPYGIRKDEFRFYRAGDRSYSLVGRNHKTTGDETPVHIPRDTRFPVPPYLPDTEVTQRDLWKMYNNIAEMDLQLGAVLKQLEADGLLDKTIIFFYADHGGPLPRQKRLIYDSGLNAPMIVRFPGKLNAGVVDQQLISFVDFVPTVLKLAGIECPDYLQGRSFLQNESPERKYIHAAADRFDEVTDAIRAVRGKRFKYIRNYRPEQGYYLPLSYREQIPSMKELLELRDNGELNEVQSQWFRSHKPEEELFDCLNDPHELHNLVENPDYVEQLEALRSEMDRWIAEIGDQPNLPERKLIEQLWNGNDHQPKTSDPFVDYYDGKVFIGCETEGASIGYRVWNESESKPRSWGIYKGPIEIPKGAHIEIKAHRIGFLPSKTIQLVVGS